MGVSPSHQACAGAAATLTPRGSKAGQVPRHSRAVLGQTVSAEDLLSVNREKKKRRSGLSTLKRRLVGRKKNWRSADHAKHFKENFSDKPAALLSALLEHYEVLLAMRDLRVQADLVRFPNSLCCELGERSACTRGIGLPWQFVAKFVIESGEWDT